MAVPTPPLLQAESVVAGYVRDLPIVHGVSLDVSPGEILVVLGPNGAGKSTLLKALAGVVPMFSGSVRMGGDDITGTPTHLLSARGVGFVPQTGNVFTTLTVEENLRIGGYLLKHELQERLAAAYAQFPDLAQRRKNAGHALSGGQRQMLAIARALMTAPKLLLLDEPSAGLAPLMVNEVFAQVEQNVKAGLRIADRGLILVNGLAAHTGAAQALREDPLVAQLYLGSHATAPARESAGALP